MIVLGLDPGSRVLGYGLIDWGAAPRFLAAGSIEATRADLPGARLREIGQGLSELLVELSAAHPIERVGIESGFFMPGSVVTEGGKRVRKSNPKADLMLANARGVALYMVASLLRIEPVFVAPSTVKKAATGNGRAEKPEVQASVKALLKMNVLPKADPADALAIAIAAAGIEA